MGIRSNQHRVNTEPVDLYIGTAYDTVKLVADNLDALTAVGDNVNDILAIDPVSVAADAAQVAADRVAVAADLVLTDADTVATAADRVQTGLDAAATAADVLTTNADAAATAADRVQTGLDVTAASASAFAASASEINAAASAAQVDMERQYSAEWANKPEDSLVSAAAGGDGIDDYSSLHHRNKAVIAQQAAETAQGLAEGARDSAQASQTAASNSADAAATSEGNAATSETKANQWAIHPEDVSIPGEVVGTYSAMHWALKAASSAAGLDHTHSNLATLNATTAAFTTELNTKLTGIEDNATADQTGAEIKAAYEAELDTNAFTDAEKSKLAGVAAGAQVNTVDSVAGKTGVVTLTKTDVGLSNVDNTSDAAKPISTATQTALAGKAAAAHTHTVADLTDVPSPQVGDAGKSLVVNQTEDGYEIGAAQSSGAGLTLETYYIHTQF